MNKRPATPSKKSARKPGRNRKRKVATNTHVAETCLQSPFGSYQLHRYPLVKNDSLRAWDAADLYCLQYLQENRLLDKTDGKPLFILNDDFGALAVALHGSHPVVVTDSWIASQSIASNANANTIDADAITVVNSMQPLDSLVIKHPGKAEAGLSSGQAKVNLAIIKITRNNALLAYQLRELRSVLADDALVIGVGMTRNIHNSTMSAFAEIIGETQSTLARKKARLVLAKHDPGIDAGEQAFPVSYSVDVEKADGQASIALLSHAALFSATRPDAGSIMLMQHIPAMKHADRVIDLGCGNGIIGITAAMLNPGIELLFTDESCMAVESASLNVDKAFSGTVKADFVQTDCLHGVDHNSADFVLCNPPFHQSNVVTDKMAWRMFQQSRDVLVRGGELWVIGNRHLGYHAKLKHLFGNCTTVASDKRFSLLKAVCPG